jgi:hypothetical protein
VKTELALIVDEGYQQTEGQSTVGDVEPVRWVEKVTSPIKNMIDSNVHVFEELSSQDGIGKLATAASKLGTSIDAGKIQTMATAAAAVKGFFSQVNVLSNAASFGMKTAIDAGLVKTAEEIKNHIGAMAKAMAEFQTQIDAINVTAADNINVKLGKTANGLGVKDANYSFTKNGVTLKFNVNVHMDTKQVSAEASKPGTVIFEAFEAGFPDRTVAAGENGTGVKIGGKASGTAKASPS